MSARTRGVQGVGAEGWGSAIQICSSNEREKSMRCMISFKYIMLAPRFEKINQASIKREGNVGDDLMCASMLNGRIKVNLQSSAIRFTFNYGYPHSIPFCH